jgi:hypothetical protein
MTNETKGRTLSIQQRSRQPFAGFAAEFSAVRNCGNSGHE